MRNVAICFIALPLGGIAYSISARGESDYDISMRLNGLRDGDVLERYPISFVDTVSHGDSALWDLSDKEIGKRYRCEVALLNDSAGDPTVANRVYRYDIRSHPVSISSYGYSQQLSFTYGGNVSEMTWKAYGPEETEHTYRFEYDGLSRLVAARHSDSDGHTGLFDTSYTYDLNGNITTLTRSGLYDYSPPYVKRYGSIDDLTYEYSGNQVTRISDLCNGPFYQGAYHFRDGADEEVEYTYDANGNMTMDLNRGITAISYDINQRPRSIVFASGAATDYLYSADGVKLQTRHRTPTLSPAAGMGVADESTGESVTDYCGPFIYEDGELTRINLENGYLSYRSYAGQRLEVPEYVFYLRDHLGNNRVTMSSGGGIYQIDHFYPFGLPMGCSYNSTHQQWRFGGKEFDRTAGLDLYDFEARAYDPSTARFTCPDPLAEDYTPISPMTYCTNNPMILIDPTGMRFTEGAQQFVDQLMSYATTQIMSNLNQTKLQQTMYNYGGEFLDKGGRLSAELESANAETAGLMAMVLELDILRKSSQDYNAVTSEEQEKRKATTSYRLNDAICEITFPTDADLGLISHEFKHLYQFEMGTFSFSEYDNGEPFYDYTDEIEAYGRQSLVTKENCFDMLRTEDYYKTIQKGSASLNTWKARGIPLNTKTDIQKFTNRSQSIFRWGGTTYIPERKTK